MPLQIRRGLNAERTQIAPSNGLVEGELLYTTDEKKLYIGTGSVGEHQGVVITGYNDSDAKDAAAEILTTGEHVGIDFAYNSGTKKLNATVDLSAFEGPIVADALKGSVFADDSSVLLDAIDKVLYGSVTGNVTGNLAGSVTGNLSGNVIGDITGNVTGNIVGDVTGSVFADDSTILVDGTNGLIVGDISARLGGDLIINGYSIVTESDGDINLTPNGTGSIFLNNTTILGGDLNITGSNITSDTDTSVNIFPGTNGLVRLFTDLTFDSLGTITKTGEINISPTSATTFGKAGIADGNVLITRDVYSGTYGQGFTFAQHHETADAVNFLFYRSRGTGFAPTAVQNGDDLADIVFRGHDGVTAAAGAVITTQVDATPTLGHVPTKFQLLTDNGTSLDTRAELSSAGVWKVNSIQGLTSTLNITGNVTGDVTGSVFADNSAMVIDGTEGGKITSPSVTLSSFLKLPVYDDDTARTAGIPSPEKGMVIFITAGTTPAATNQMQVFDGSNWVNV